MQAQDSQWSELENHLEVKSSGLGGRAGGGARPMSRPQQGAQAGWAVSLLGDDLAGGQVSEGKMVRSVLGMKLEMPAGHPGGGWAEGVGGQRKVPKYYRQRLQGRRG